MIIYLVTMQSKGNKDFSHVLIYKSVQKIIDYRSVDKVQKSVLCIFFIYDVKKTVKLATKWTGPNMCFTQVCILTESTC
jgi:hypothetical protein